jgi:hypothetical protein
MTPTQTGPSPSAQIEGILKTAGYWQITETATVNYHKKDESVVWTGTGTLGQSPSTAAINVIDPKVDITYSGDVMHDDQNDNESDVSYPSTNNGSDIATNQTLNVEAGWPINVGTQVTPSDQTMTYQWTVAGSGGTPPTAIKNFNVVYSGQYNGSNVNSTSGNVVPLGSSDLNIATPPTFHFIDNASHNVSCAVTIAGQQISAQTTFSASKPSINITTTTDSVHLDQYQSTPGIAIGLGDVNANPSVAGITFQASAIPNGYNGSIKWIQIYTPDMSAVDNASPPNTYSDQGSGLDTTYPYLYPDITIQNRQDDPCQGLANGLISLAVNDSATMWLLYTPTLSGSIQVPIQKVNWSWSGTCTYNSQTQQWALSNPANTGPNGTNTNAYPIWSQFANLNWVKN